MDTELARQQMIAQQIRTCEVVNADVLNVIRDIPRDEYVPAKCVDVAYADTEIPLAHGQCMLRPSTVGKILQALDLKRNDEVLEIGTGTGYLTTCLAKLAGFVTSVDIFEDFVTSANEKLSASGIENVAIERMDVMSELPEGPFDVITITSAVPEFREAYGELLKPGGRLLLFIGESPVVTAVLATRTDNEEFEIEELFETDIPELVNLPEESTFFF